MQQYNYRLKIINQSKKSEFVIREIHDYHEKFSSIAELKLYIMNAFTEHVPPTTNFQIGYFLGKQSSKYWLVNQDDLDLMYTSLKKKDIVLWCDARSESTTNDKKRRLQVENTNDPPPSKRKLIEDKVDEMVEKLKERHDDHYTLPQMRLWARMISAGHHDSLDDPPRIPAITGVTPKRKQRQSLAEAIAGAATTLVSAVHNKGAADASPAQSPATDTRVGHSPSKISDLRMKNLKELRELQQLLEDNILTEEEFAEQKEIVLNAMRKLKH